MSAQRHSDLCIPNETSGRRHNYLMRGERSPRIGLHTGSQHSRLVHSRYLYYFLVLSQNVLEIAGNRRWKIGKGIKIHSVNIWLRAPGNKHLYHPIYLCSLTSTSDYESDRYDDDDNSKPDQNPLAHLWPPILTVLPAMISLIRIICGTSVSV